MWHVLLLLPSSSSVIYTTTTTCRTRNWHASLYVCCHLAGPQNIVNVPNCRHILDRVIEVHCTSRSYASVQCSAWHWQPPNRVLQARERMYVTSRGKSWAGDLVVVCSRDQGTSCELRWRGRIHLQPAADRSVDIVNKRRYQADDIFADVWVAPLFEACCSRRPLLRSAKLVGNEVGTFITFYGTFTRSVTASWHQKGSLVATKSVKSPCDRVT